MEIRSIPSFSAFVTVFICVILVHFKVMASSDEKCLRCKRGASNTQYAAIIDGGSSGSRIRVYRWESLSPSDEKALPDIKEIFSFKKEPGVSDYVNQLDQLTAYLKDLINVALEKIPEDDRHTTDLYFMATAGMRLLLEDKANHMVEQIDRLLTDKSTNPLRYLSPDNSRILSGEEEGVFAWISVNYLKNVFSKKNVRAKNTYGILELGGASTQIAFAPKGNILADKFPVFISGVTYYLYVHSYLYYGQNFVDLWVKEQLYAEYNETHTHESNPRVQSPCMVKGDTLHFDLHGKMVTYIGGGSHNDCKLLLEKLVYKIREQWKCQPKPCSIGTVYQPTIQPTMEFIAIGAFVHAFDKLKVLPDGDRFSYHKTVEKVADFCSLDKDVVTRDYKPDKEEFTSVPCLMGTYSPMLFARGYRFPEETNQISVKKDIHGRTADWTLGAIVYEYEKNIGKCRTCCGSTAPSPSSSTLFTITLCLASRYFWW